MLPFYPDNICIDEDIPPTRTGSEENRARNKKWQGNNKERLAEYKREYRKRKRAERSIRSGDAVVLQTLATQSGEPCQTSGISQAE